MCEKEKPTTILFSNWPKTSGAKVSHPPFGGSLWNALSLGGLEPFYPSHSIQGVKVSCFHATTPSALTVGCWAGVCRFGRFSPVADVPLWKPQCTGKLALQMGTPVGAYSILHSSELQALSRLPPAMATEELNVSGPWGGQKQGLLQLYGRTFAPPCPVAGLG